MNNKYIKTLFLGLAMTCALPALAQNKVVQGTVVDENGEPVIGATVRVEGTKIATVTDFDGNYKVDAPADANIVISYIGYKDTNTKGGRVALDTDYNDLDEVVVVGYGTQKRHTSPVRWQTYQWKTSRTWQQVTLQAHLAGL